MIHTRAERAVPNPTPNTNVRSITRPCAHASCGTPFTATIGIGCGRPRLYCSDPCRLRAVYARVKARRAAAQDQARSSPTPAPDPPTPAPRAFLDPTTRVERATAAKQASGRRRLIDPTTCERDYSGAEFEFMQAMERYKVASKRPFPTWSEALEVLL